MGRGVAVGYARVGGVRMWWWAWLAGCVDADPLDTSGSSGVQDTAAITTETDGAADTDLPDTDAGDTDAATDSADTDRVDTDLGDTSDSDPADTDVPCDADDDGYPSPACGGRDCDDAAATVFPGAPDRPNRVDDDCDGVVDRDNIGDIAWRFTSSPVADERITSIDNLATGDFDGDGRLELVAGCPVGASGAGGAYGFDGAGIGSWLGSVSTDARFTLVAETSSDALGFVAARFGDLDGDGRDDLAIGARQHGDVGRAYIFTDVADLVGSIDVADARATVDGRAVTGRAGWAVDGSGDLDGDGIADLAVGDPYASGTDGEVALFFSVPSGAVTMADASVVLGGAATSRLGEMITVGDADADGYADLLLGTPGSDAGAGAVAWVSGGLDLTDGAVDDRVLWQFVGDGGGEVGGNSRGTAPPADLDGSGSPDVVVADYLTASSVYVFLDPEAGTYTSADADGVATVADAGFGAALRTGDLDGDGTADLVIGALYDRSTVTDGGSVSILWGGAGGFSGTFDRSGLDAVIEADGRAEYLGTSIAYLGDVAGDGREHLAIGASWDGALALRGGTIWVVAPR